MKGLLKVMSVLNIVLGVLGIIGAVIILVGSGLIGTLAEVEDTEGVVVLLIIVGVISLISAIFDLVCGIFGMKGANGDEKKLNTAIKLGWVGLILAVISIALNLVGDMTMDNILSTILSVVAPAIFLIAAKGVKKQYDR